MRKAIVAAALLLASCSGNAAPGPSASKNPSPPVSFLAASSTPSAGPTDPVATPPPRQTPESASPTPIPLPSFADVAAAGNGVVWVLVAGDHLFRSLDRGATWQERTIPPQPQLGKISFVDDLNGWMLVAGPPTSGCGSQYLAVWRTTDGAATWERAFESAFDSSAPASRGCKASLAFVDAQRGYISVVGRDVAPAILRSVDGGRTWAVSQRLPDPPGFRFEPSVSTLTPGAVADFGSTLLVPVLSQVSGDVRRLLFRSTDRGATWTYAVTAPTASDIVFLTPTRWLQITLAWSSSETTDAGASWHSFATDYGQAAGVAPQIVFGDATTGYATVRGAVQRTTDGGAHWTYLTTPGTRAATP